jgi:prepilin signal peptidase PulO-like enzyme (type II secretory pathway)
VIFFALALGAIFGSFASAAIYRLPRGISLGLERSRCPACQTALGPYDLVPLFSWLISGGRCRHCQTGISIRYPAIEVISSLLFLIAWLVAPTPPAALVLALFSLALLIEAAIDLEFGILPDKVQIFLLPLGTGYRWLSEWTPLDMGIGFVAGLGASLILKYGFLIITKRDGLGWGDIKLIAIAGGVLGLSGLIPFFILSGALGVGLGLAWRKFHSAGTFPFGPALTIALFLCLTLHLVV